MSKIKKTDTTKNYAQPLPPLPFVDSSNSTLMKIKTRKEHWSEFELDDGNIIKLQAVPVEIRKLHHRKTESGDPIYLVKSTNITDTVFGQQKKAEKNKT